MMQPQKRKRFIDRDNFLWGFLVGLCVPVMAYGILLTLYDFLESQLWASDIGFAHDFRTRTLMLLSIVVNLIPFHYYQRRRMDNTMRGMVLPTIVFVGIWFYLYGRHLVEL